MIKRFAIPMLLVAAALAGHAADKPKPAPRDIYEFRAYTLNEGGDASLIHDYLKNALIPALERQGAGPVGVFEELEASEEPKLYVFIAYPTLNAWSSSSIKLNKDKAYQKAGKAYLDTPRENRAYQSIETNVLRAFSGFPHLTKTNTSKNRIFEYRTYISHSEQKHKLKVEMFNKGEIDVFNNIGFTSIFYAQNIAGPNLPSLSYMTMFKDTDEQAMYWGKFKTDPGWAKLKVIERYKGTVSSSIKRILKPTDYSGI